MSAGLRTVQISLREHFRKAVDHRILPAMIAILAIASSWDAI